MMELNCFMPFESVTSMVNSVVGGKGTRKGVEEELICAGGITGGAAV